MSSTALQRLEAHLRSGVHETHSHRGDDTALIEHTMIRAACLWLRDEDELAFNMLTDLTAVDYLDLGRTPRFEVVYHLYSIQRKQRLRLKIGIAADKPVADTVSDIWAVANWMEREVWDMYGIHFSGHPDLRRILNYEQFVGHPLRKDYPKHKRQPLCRRPTAEIEAALAGRPGSGHVPGIAPQNPHQPGAVK